MCVALSFHMVRNTETWLTLQSYVLTTDIPSHQRSRFFQSVFHQLTPVIVNTNMWVPQRCSWLWAVLHSYKLKKTVQQATRSISQNLTVHIRSHSLFSNNSIGMVLAHTCNEFKSTRTDSETLHTLSVLLVNFSRLHSTLPGPQDTARQLKDSL